MMYCVYILYRNTQSIYKVHKTAYFTTIFLGAFSFIINLKNIGPKSVRYNIH